LSAAGTLLPIAAGIVVLATRPRGDPVSGEPADETYDVVGGILIGVGLGLGPSLGHFYAHDMGWFVPRVLVGGALGLAAAGSDLGNGVGLALLGLTAVTVMAARDISTAPAAAQRYNTRRLGLALGLDLARADRRLGLRLGVTAKLWRHGYERPLWFNKRMVPLGGWVLQRLAILPEEAYLDRKFGDTYRAYKDRVRPWL
jgi:hypothetical protein